MTRFSALALLLAVVTTMPTANANSAWMTVSDWKPSQVKGISYKITCNKTYHQFNAYFRNDSNTPITITWSWGEGEDGGRFKLVPFQIRGGGYDGAWTMKSSCDAGVSVVVESVSAEAASIDLPFDSISELKRQDELLKAAGFAEGLVAWSPLASLLDGGDDAQTAVVNVSTTDWQQLESDLRNVRALTLNSLAFRCDNESYRNYGNKPVREFWKNLAAAYRNAAPH